MDRRRIRDMTTETKATPRLNNDHLYDRLIDANILLNHGRKHGAFIQALIALAGLATIRYPMGTPEKIYFDKMREYHPNQASEISDKEKAQPKKNSSLSDGQRYKCIVLDLVEDIFMPQPIPGTNPPKINIDLPFCKEKKTNIEDLFYKMLRCTAVHQGTFSSVAYLTERIPEGDVLHLTEPAGIPERWIVNLVEAISRAPELTSQFPESHAG